MGVGPGLPTYKLSTFLPQDTLSLSTSLVTICAAQRSTAVRGHQGTVPQRLPRHTTHRDMSEMKIMGSRRILSTTRYSMAGPILHPFPCSQDPRLHSPAAELVLSPPPRPAWPLPFPFLAQESPSWKTLSAPGRPSTRGLLPQPPSNRTLAEAHRHAQTSQTPGLHGTHTRLYQKTAS